jgi:hypothetical protein
MYLNSLRVLAALVVAVGFCSQRLNAQINSILNADVQSFFSASSDAAGSQQADPATLAPWGGSAGFGPYPITGPSNVPSGLTTPFFPATLVPANSFVGGAYSSTFFDLPSSTLSQSTIMANPPGGANVADGNVLVNFTMVNPSLTYSYHQLNFELDYLSTGSLGGGTVGAPTLFVSGSTTGATAYAQFAGRLNYYWTSINTAGVVGATSNLGFLEYNWSITGPNPSFLAIPVNPLSTSNLAATPAGGGVLSIVGELFVAGDPANISVSTVPEPGTMLLTLLGLLCASAWQLRRRQLAKVSNV